MKERQNLYPEVLNFEVDCGFAVELEKLENAARVLACPLKVNPPSWQHGRVIYAAIRKLLAVDSSEGVVLDIGTAKGFSAVVAGWAVADSKTGHGILSVDIVDPILKVCRNSVAEMDGELFTVAEFVRPFKDQSVHTKFFGGGSLRLLQHLKDSNQRVRFAFVDGKHSYELVAAEMVYLRGLQQKGDIVVLDDLQIPPVGMAVAKMRGYDITMLSAGLKRQYAVAVHQ